jgi:DNA-binding winged helix-turn-helix (wHTH) protein/TolB-like protein/Flp pilus assembly protein TadD
MVKQSNHLYEFGPYRLDVDERLLLKNEESITLTPKAFETLVVLVRRNGHLVTKEELLREVWPDSFVEEGNLSQNIYTLRKALGDEGGEHRYIETVPRKGYRFVATVREHDESEDALVIHQQTHAKTVNEEQVTDALSLNARVPAFLSSQILDSSPFFRKRFVVGIVAFLLLTAVLGVVAYRWRSPVQKPVSDSFTANSIAVLPFKSLTNNKSDELLGLGMADATIVKLSNFQQIPVLPTSAVFKYTGRDNDPLSAGKELNVDAVVDGTIQHVGDRVRVTVQLLSLTQGRTLWSGRFDEQFTNIFAVQDSISEQVARALALQITGEKKKQLEKRYTQSTEAYQAYLMGLYFWNRRTQEGLANAVQYFQKAIDLDPEYALAYAGLADSYGLIAYYRYDTMPPQEAREKCQINALRALALDNTIAEAHTALALVPDYRNRDSTNAEASLKRAIELNPNYATAHQRYAWHLVAWGRLNEGTKEMRRAQELDPLSLPINTALGNMRVFSRDYDEAVALFQRVLTIDPNNALARYNLGLAYELKGEYERAVEEYEKARDTDSNPTNSVEVLAHLYATAGRTNEAQRLLQELQNGSKHKGRSPFSIALIYAALGRREDSIKWLDRAIADGSVQLISLRYDPRLDTLRSDPLYKEFLKRHELADLVPASGLPGASPKRGALES